MKNKSIAISVAFHVAVVVVGTVSLPWVKRTYDIPPPISIELAEIAPMTQTTRVAPPAPKQEEPKEAVPKPPPAARNTASTPAPPVPKPPEPKKEEPKKQEPAKQETAVAPPEKKPPEPEKKKPEPEKKTPPPQPDRDFSSVLRNLQDSPTEPQPKTDEPDLKLNEKAPPAPGAQAPLGARMTMSEEDALRRQLEGCWNVPFGAKDAQDLRVEIFMVIRPDRTLQDARVVDQSRYNSDSFFRAAADSAMRAVRNPSCSPFQLPPDKYEVWKTVTVTFDPSQMF